MVSEVSESTGSRRRAACLESHDNELAAIDLMFRAKDKQIAALQSQLQAAEKQLEEMTARIAALEQRMPPAV